jgi:hypothetical protein
LIGAEQIFLNFFTHLLQILASTAAVSQSLKPAAALKISNVHLPISSTNSGDYWVELIALEETILDGYIIEVAEDSQGNPSFKEYVTFPQGIVLEEGRRIRISQIQGDKEKGVKYLLGAKTPLTPKITWIRLLKINGYELVHQKVVQPDANYSDTIISHVGAIVSGSDALLLPNLDGTRALLALRDQTTGVNIPSGGYRLTFDFSRNIGSQAPILSETGDTMSESVTLQFIIT